jgi:hypothetical protein
MLTITESAWNRLSHLQATYPDVTTMRLPLKDGGLKCHRGNQRRLDRVIKHPGRPTLLLTPAVAKDLWNDTLVAEATKRGPRLRIKRDQSLDT